MNRFRELLERGRVIIAAAPTWIMVAVGVANYLVVNNAAELGPDVAAWIAQAVPYAVGAVAVIRRVSPVPVEERGILPPE